MNSKRMAVSTGIVAGVTGIALSLGFASTASAMMQPEGHSRSTTITTTRGADSARDKAEATTRRLDSTRDKAEANSGLDSARDKAEANSGLDSARDKAEATSGLDSARDATEAAREAANEAGDDNGVDNVKGNDDRPGHDASDDHGSDD